MTRIYSKTGCRRCKMRRVKCTEERPSCSACTKWHWSCIYSSEQSVADPPPNLLVKVHANQLLSYASRGLLPYQGDEIEGKVLRDIPDSMKAFFSPASGSRIRDLQIMFQLMTSNNLLRDAGVACFSVIAKDPKVFPQLTQETYGKALRSLRLKVMSEDLHNEDLICVIASVVFLGKMESFGPHSSADALEHWMALIPLLGSDKVTKMINLRVIPLSEIMLFFESLLYHVGTHAIFSKATDRVWHLWQANNTYLRLCTLNPEGPNRLSQSPLLFGQYALYNMAFQLSYLLRFHRFGHLPSAMADQIEAAIRYRDGRLDTDLQSAEPTSTPMAKYNAERAVYHLFCNSLLICVTALRESSQNQRLEMEKLVTIGMKLFLDIPSYGDVEFLSQHATHFMLAAVWPVLVQGCAVYDALQLQVFMDHYTILEKFLDPGHQRRSRAFLMQVSNILNNLSTNEKPGVCVKGEGRPLPLGLTLLRNAGGVGESE